eukprot:1156753-Pelagomonas_calceolata.AAC.8
MEVPGLDVQNPGQDMPDVPHPKSTGGSRTGNARCATKHSAANHPVGRLAKQSINQIIDAGGVDPQTLRDSLEDMQQLLSAIDVDVEESVRQDDAS